MSQITNTTVLNVIIRRLRKRITREVSKQQRGFVAGKDMSNVTFMLRTTAEKQEKQSDLLVCCIDHEKAFDKLRDTYLMEALKSIGVTAKECRGMNYTGHKRGAEE